MLALSIRQPYAELILRGVKTVEYRSRPTRLIGQRFYIYVARQWAGALLPLPLGEPPEWGEGSLELSKANGRKRTSPDPLTPNPSPRGRGELQQLPTGVIVGSAVISKCIAVTSRDCEGAELSGGMRDPLPDGRGSLRALYEWHLTGVKRYKHPRKVKRQPQPVWFRPF